MGDLNINLLHDTCFANRLKSAYRLSQLITEPTRITKKSTILIDHINTSQKFLNCTCEVVEIHQSDYSSILWE